MSVLYTLSDDVLELAGDVLAWLCADCAEPLAPPLVYWQGANLLLFHPACAAHLGPHLIADAREATLATGREPRWRRRLLAAVRHRLEREEVVA